VGKRSTGACWFGGEREVKINVIPALAIPDFLPPGRARKGPKVDHLQTPALSVNLGRGIHTLGRKTKKKGELNQKKDKYIFPRQD